MAAESAGRRARPRDLDSGRWALHPIFVRAPVFLGDVALTLAWRLLSRARGYTSGTGWSAPQRDPNEVFLKAAARRCTVTLSPMKAVDAGPIVMELDGDFRHRAASDAALALLGLPVEALLGRTSTEAGPPSEVVEPLQSARLAAVVEGGAQPRATLELEDARVPSTACCPRWPHLRGPAPEPGPGGGDPREEEGGLAG